MIPCIGPIRMADKSGPGQGRAVPSGSRPANGTAGASAAYGPGLPPAGGWKLAMKEDPTEYSPEFQDEYRRLWHEAAAERDRLSDALERIAAGPRPDGTYNLSREACEQIAKEALSVNPSRGNEPNERTVSGASCAEAGASAAYPSPLDRARTDPVAATPVQRPSQEATAAYSARLRTVAVGFRHVLRLVIWLVPFCLVVFGGAGAEVAARWLWRASDWILDRADLDSARDWKDGILGR